MLRDRRNFAVYGASGMIGFRPLSVLWTCDSSDTLEALLRIRNGTIVVIPIQEINNLTLSISRSCFARLVPSSSSARIATPLAKGQLPRPMLFPQEDRVRTPRVTDAIPWESVQLEILTTAISTKVLHAWLPPVPRALHVYGTSRTHTTLFR